MTTDHVPPTVDPRHPGERSGRWRSGDVFRAIMFGVLAVIYAVLLFPLAVGFATLWLVGKVIDRAAPAAS